MTDTYVPIYGAWHTGAELGTVDEFIRNAGHTSSLPDDRGRIGLEDAIQSAVDYLESVDISDIRLVGHSYVGMIISGVADRVPYRLKRLVYANAIVPLDGEAVNDMVPPSYQDLFERAAVEGNNTLTLPFVIQREAFINDADLALAASSYARLNPHPHRAFTDRIRLKAPLAELPVGNHM